jgi:hypothetical protein
MGIIPKSRYDSFHHFPPAQPKKKLWDPFTTLGFNPDGGSFTCVGIAKSTKERCCNPINKANRASSFQLLEDLSYIDVSTTDINAELHKLARLSLCLRNHQSQQNDMVKNWSKAIKKTQSASRNNIKIKIDPDEFEELLKYKEALIAHLRNRNDGAKEFMFSSPTSQRYPKQNDGQSAQEERTRKQREEETRKSRERERERERQQQEREKEAREEKEKMKRNEEKAQQKRAEEKAKQKREEEKRCREEQEAREREAREREERNERVRQRADQARKERERKAKEQAAKARDEWDESWLKYVLQWDKLKSKFFSIPGFRLVGFFTNRDLEQDTKATSVCTQHRYTP